MGERWSLDVLGVDFSANFGANLLCGWGGNLPEEEETMLAHQKLKVYGKALAAVAGLTNHSVQWDKRHAVVDQLCRASESVVLNLVEGVRVSNLAHKQQRRHTWICA
jgi:hypothetical protein